MPNPSPFKFERERLSPQEVLSGLSYSGGARVPAPVRTATPPVVTPAPRPAVPRPLMPDFRRPGAPAPVRTPALAGGGGGAPAAASTPSAPKAPDKISASGFDARRVDPAKQRFQRPTMPTVAKPATPVAQSNAQRQYAPGAYGAGQVASDVLRAGADVAGRTVDAALLNPARALVRGSGNFVAGLTGQPQPGSAPAATAGPPMGPAGTRPAVPVAANMAPITAAAAQVPPPVAASPATRPATPAAQPTIASPMGPPSIDTRRATATGAAGEPVFTNASFRPGEAAQLAQRNVLQTVVPGPGVASSMATGGAQVPSFVRPEANRDVALRGITRDARADTPVAPSPFSQEGTALANLESKLRFAFPGSPGSRAAYANLVGQQFQARNAATAEGQRARSGLATEAQKQQDDLARVGLINQGAVAAEAERGAQQRTTEFARPQFELGADGSLYQLNQGVATPVTDAGGLPFAPDRSNPAQADAARAQVLKALLENMGGVQGLQPDQLQPAVVAAGQAADTLLGGRGGAQPPAGATAIGTAPDGRVVYQDAQGNQFTLE